MNVKAVSQRVSHKAGMTSFSDSPDDASKGTMIGRPRRATDVALERWQMLRRDGLDAPTLGEIAREQDDASRRNQFILRCDERIDRSVFIYCGETARAGMGNVDNGQILGESLVPDLRSRIHEACAAVLRHWRPLFIDGRFADSGLEVLFRCIVMPAHSTIPEKEGRYLVGAFSCNRPLAAWN
jgi:hypothetical protein